MSLNSASANYSLHFKRFFKTAAIAAFVFMALPLATGCAHTSEQDKKQAQIAYDLGVNNFQHKRYRKAVFNFEQSIKYDIDFAPAHNGLGLLYHALQRYDESLRHYQRAIALDPKYSDAKNNLASLYIDQKKYKKALPLLNEVLSDLFYKTPYLAETNLGWAKYKLGDTKSGIKHTRKAVILNPALCLGYKNLGVIYEEQNNLEQAEKYFKKYAKKCPKVADAHYRLGSIYLKMNKSEDARMAFTECALYAPESTDIAEECEKLSKTLEAVK